MLEDFERKMRALRVEIKKIEKEENVSSEDLDKVVEEHPTRASARCEQRQAAR